MEKPSSDFLFHFTDSIEAMVNIINVGFWYRRHAVPKITERGYSYTYSPDFISFTDTPLYQIDNHAKTYGKFGIGMKKNWALKVGGQPVMYIGKSSLYYRSIKQNNKALGKLATTYAKLPDGDPLKSEIKGFINDFFLSFNGLHGVSEVHSNYSEREWRIIRDDTNKYQQTNLNFDDQYETLKFPSSDIVLLVAPSDHIPVLIKSIQDILNKRDESILFPIIPFEYLKSI